MTLCTWLWTDPHGRWNQIAPYTPESVRRWAAMVRPALGIPHELAVITDQPGADFGSDVRAIPLWPDLAEMGRCWRRLKFFAPEMADIIGHRIAWMDLDVVVTGDLTPIFDRPDDAVFWAPQTTKCSYNGSIVLLSAGARAQVWSTFPGPAAARKAVAGSGQPGSDQAWIAGILGRGEAVWTQRDGVYPYWRDCLEAKPAAARCVFFPGSLKANASIVRKHSPWVAETLSAALPWRQAEYPWQEQSRVTARQRRRAASAARLAKQRAAARAPSRTPPPEP